MKKALEESKGLTVDIVVDEGEVLTSSELSRILREKRNEGNLNFNFRLINKN